MSVSSAPSVSRRKIASFLKPIAVSLPPGARASRPLWKLLKGCMCVQHCHLVDVHFSLTTLGRVGAIGVLELLN